MPDPADKKISGDTFFHIIPILLMVLIGISQMLFSMGPGLIVSDKGGGFGMFSTVDKKATRILRVTLTTEQRLIHLPLSLRPSGSKALWQSQESLQLMEHMIISPTTTRMANVARMVGRGCQDLRESGLIEQQQAEQPSHINVYPELKDIREIRLELWRTRFSSDSQTIRRELFKSVTIRWPNGDLLHDKLHPVKLESP